MYPNNALVPFAVRLAPTNGNVMLVNPLQPLNAEAPMLVTLEGIVMLVNPLQPENAEAPILITPTESM
jgi:hypothetical protein